MKARRRLLIIAFHYPPIQGSSGVQRALAFSKYLPDFGWDVTVLTVAPRAHENLLAENESMIPSYVRVARAQAWDAARHFSIRGRYPSMLERPDRWCSWIPFGILTGLREIRSRRPDAILATFPIASAHVIGCTLHRLTGVPLVVDFRDPMATATYPHEESLRRLWMSIQDKAVRESRLVTVTTPGAARFYRSLYRDVAADRFVVIENGFDPDAFSYLEPRTATPGPLVLVHSGILYPRERDPKPFFRALRRLIDERVIAVGTLRVLLRASGFEDEYRRLVDELDLGEVVQFGPPIPYVDAIAEMAAASALLLFQAKVCNDQIPAKAYEYLYAGRPILGLTDPAGDTGQLLGRLGVANIVPLEDEGAIAEMLRVAIPRIRDGSQPLPSRDSVMTLSRRAGCERLAAILDGIVAV